MIGVLFVCLGNICRSPMAEAIFRQLVADAGLSGQFEIDSAGTSDWEVGEPPHYGTVNILKANQIPLRRGKVARQITQHDLDHFQYIVAMDTANIRALGRSGRRVYRLMEFADSSRSMDVPDPYYNHNFEEVFAMVQAGCRGLLAFIRQNEGM